MATEIEATPETPIRWKILVDEGGMPSYYKRYGKTEAEVKEVLEAQFKEWNEKYIERPYKIIQCEQDKTKTVTKD